jgi:hypothetical protein
MEQGYKVQRKSQKRRLNGLCYYLRNGHIWTEQTHELSQHRKDMLLTLSEKSITATDWEVVK